ncbi:MAG TPA: M20/M25/M40 family metallo-hydrolase [Candidatus Acidoferrales bacterium]|nr:M20/M25/M40 family metallo-hydrolase [Candidatus Acidoferrales bacterium]
MSILSGSFGWRRFSAIYFATALAGVLLMAPTGRAQDPAEPPSGAPAPKLLPRPEGRIARSSVDENEMRDIINEQVACGTRDSFSSWTDPKRGIGCGRDHIVPRFQAIAKDSGGRLQVIVDKFETDVPRSAEKLHLENVYAILPGSDPALAKTVFLVGGDFDSRPSRTNDPNADAPGADDDSSGVAVAIEGARLLSGGKYRATLLFAALSGEEEGLLGAQQMLKYLQANGYTIGGYENNDIVGSDPAPGGPHRVRVFSGGGPDGVDSPSRELARAIEEIDGRDNIRLIFRLDRLGRGGDHIPFVMAGLPAVRFSEPQENYDHQHQTPRTENGREYGDFAKFLDFKFMGNVALDNAEPLRELAMAPAPPTQVTMTHQFGTAMGNAEMKWSAPVDPQRAGYEILWRETTEPRWSVYDFVPEDAAQEAASEVPNNPAYNDATVPGSSRGQRRAARETNPTITTNAGTNASSAPAANGAPGAETTMTRVLDGVSPDNHFFAVRTVGKNGARSLAVPAVVPPRPARPPAAVTKQPQ